VYKKRLKMLHYFVYHMTRIQRVPFPIAMASLANLGAIYLLKDNDEDDDKPNAPEALKKIENKRVVIEDLDAYLLKLRGRSGCPLMYTNSYSTGVPTNSQRIHPSPPVSHHLILVSCLCHFTRHTDEGKLLGYDSRSIEWPSSILGDLDTVPGDSAYTIPTRPIHKLVQRLDEARTRLIQESRVQPVSSPPPLVQLVVIGGGAAGCELAMAISYRWRQELAPSSILFSCLILDADDTDSLLPNESAQDFAPPLDRRSTGMQGPRNHFRSYCSQTKQRQREPGNDTYSVHALCLGHGSWIARLGTTFASNAGFSLH
jgi:hypothetical protein